MCTLLTVPLSELGIEPGLIVVQFPTHGFVIPTFCKQSWLSDLSKVNENRVMCYIRTVGTLLS